MRPSSSGIRAKFTAIRHDLASGEHLGLTGGLFVVAEVEPPHGLPPASCTQNDSACSMTVHGGGKRRKVISDQAGGNPLGGKGVGISVQ
jgi:hypothetical protein